MKLHLFLVQGQQFRIRIQLPSSGILKGAIIECEWRLQHLLQGHKNIIQQVRSKTHACHNFKFPLTGNCFSGFHGCVIEQNVYDMKLKKILQRAFMSASTIWETSADLLEINHLSNLMVVNWLYVHLLEKSLVIALPVISWSRKNESKLMKSTICIIFLSTTSVHTTYVSNLVMLTFKINAFIV